MLMVGCLKAHERWKGGVWMPVPAGSMRGNNRCVLVPWRRKLATHLKLLLQAPRPGALPLSPLCLGVALCSAAGRLLLGSLGIRLRVGS